MYYSFMIKNLLTKVTFKLCYYLFFALDFIYILVVNFKIYLNKNRNTVIDDFNSKKFFLLNNFLERDIVNLFLDQIRFNEKNGNHISYGDLLITERGISSILKSIQYNSLIYNPPMDLFSQYTFIKDPLSSISGLKDLIHTRIIPIAEKLMSSSVSIENIQVYKTPYNPNIFKENANFHYDSIDISKSFKIMIYLTDVDASSGPLAIAADNADNPTLLTGNAGTLIAFQASNLLHAGLSPTSPNGDRWVLNFKIYPKIFGSEIQSFGSTHFSFIRRKILFFNMGYL